LLTRSRLCCFGLPSFILGVLTQLSFRLGQLFPLPCVGCRTPAVSGGPYSANTCTWEKPVVWPVRSAALFGAVYRLQFCFTRHLVEPVYSRCLSGGTTSSV
jgi:hypothetical protein